MKKYNNALDKEIIKVLKQNKRYGLTRFKICEGLNLEKYTYEAVIRLPSGSYFQVRILHHKRTTVYEHLIKLQNKNLIECYSLIDGVGKPKIYWKLK